MSVPTITLFLHALLHGSTHPTDAIRDAEWLRQLLCHPPATLVPLVQAHLEVWLAELPKGAELRPATVPASVLWVAAVLNNLAVRHTHTNPRLLTITLRLSEALPPAATLEAALAYHSLLRHLSTLWPHDIGEWEQGDAAWETVVRRLVVRSPLTALCWPFGTEHLDWQVVMMLLKYRPLSVLVWERLLELLPADMTEPQLQDRRMARANARAGDLLAALLAHGDRWGQHFVLTLYEADCERQRRDCTIGPTWPLLTLLRRAIRSDDTLIRSNARLLLKRYSPLVKLPDALPRPYARLHTQFLYQLESLVPVFQQVPRRPVPTTGTQTDALSS